MMARIINNLEDDNAAADYDHNVYDTNNHASGAVKTMTLVRMTMVIAATGHTSATAARADADANSAAAAVDNHLGAQDADAHHS